MRVAVTGATGLIGRALAAELCRRGDEVITLGRDPATLARLLPATRPLAWSPISGPPPPEALEGVDAVVHLAGEPIADRPWTPEQKRRIRDSRVIGTRNLVAGIARAAVPPAVLVAGSAIGIYGDRGDELIDESTPEGDDFLASVVRAWESEARAAEGIDVRVALARTGVVLAREGGALPRLTLPFRFFVGGPLGNGRQWMSWIHIDDEVGLLLRLIDDSSLSGPVNLVAPEPARNGVLAAAIGRALRRPALLPAPRLALRLVLGERVDLLLASQRVVPTSAEEAGYSFRFRELDSALIDLLRR